MEHAPVRPWAAGSLIVWLVAGGCSGGQQGARTTPAASAPSAAAPTTDRAMSHLPVSVAAWANGARQFEGLGSFHRDISSGSAEARKYFDQGMRFMWAFNHDES